MTDRSDPQPLTWHYYKRLAVDPTRIAALHRVEGTTNEAQTYMAGEWVPIPREALNLSGEGDTLIEPITEEQAALVAARMGSTRLPVEDVP